MLGHRELGVGELWVSWQSRLVENQKVLFASVWQSEDQSMQVGRQVANTSVSIFACQHAMCC